MLSPEIETFIRQAVREELERLKPVPQEEPPLSVSQVAERLGVSKSLIRQFIAVGAIKCHRLGGKFIRVPASEINRLLSEGTAK